MNRFLIVGAGITGMTAGYELARAGHQVDVVERGSVVGGHVLDYCCKATDSCSRCGVCVAHTQLAQSLRHPGIRVHTNAVLEAAGNHHGRVTAQLVQTKPLIDYARCVACGACVAACPDGAIRAYDRGGLRQYRIDQSLCRLSRGEQCLRCAAVCPSGAVDAVGKERRQTLSADAVLVATGHEPFDASRHARYGYKRNRNVLTGAEAEAILADRMDLGIPGADVAFIQCVGSRDPVLGRNFCSGVCCAYALRLARILRYRDPAARVTVYYIDIQNFDKAFTPFRREIADSGVRFVRGVPFRIDEKADGRLRLSTVGSDGADQAAEHDQVVLSIGVDCREGAARVAELFELERDAHGFFRSRAMNVFVGGTCAEPMSIPESMSAARAVAVEMGKSRE